MLDGDPSIVQPPAEPRTPSEAYADFIVNHTERSAGFLEQFKIQFRGQSFSRPTTGNADSSTSLGMTIVRRQWKFLGPGCRIGASPIPAPSCAVFFPSG